MVEMIALRTFAHRDEVVRRGAPVTATMSEALGYEAGPNPLARRVEAKAVSAPAASEGPKPAASKAKPAKPAKGKGKK